jgi:stress response protein SCP2
MDRDAEGATDATLVERVAQPTGKGKGDSENADVQANQVPVEGAKMDMTVPLREVLLCVQWGFPVANHEQNQPNQGVVNRQPDYLDGSCLVYAEERLLDVIDFRGAHSATMCDCKGQKASSATFEWSAGKGQAASVLHSGDVMDQESGTHVIRVQVDALPACATDVFFMISAYNCRNLSLFHPLSVRLLDGSKKDSHERPPVLGELPVANAGTASAIVTGALTRRLESWFLREFTTTPCQATVRDYAPVEALLALAQERHCRWRRRRQFILLSLLCQHGRAVPIDSGAFEGSVNDCPEEDDLVLRLFKLPTILFQCIVQLL